MNIIAAMTLSTDGSRPRKAPVAATASLLLASGGIYGGMLIFKKKLVQIRDLQTGVNEKFALYRAASMVQWALAEGPSIFCTVCLLLTGNYAFLALAVVLMFLFVMIGPSKLKMQLQLQLTESEMDGL